MLSAQFDIGAAVLMTGLTNVLTITSGLCRIRGNYSGFSTMSTHTAGGGSRNPDP